MPKALDDYGSLAVCDDPGRAVRTVAEKLVARGFGVLRPERQESPRLTITCAERARCELTVEDGGSARWDYRPRSGRGTGPAEMTALVLRVLGAEDVDEPRTRARPRAQHQDHPAAPGQDRAITEGSLHDWQGEHENAVA
jgi:hypothetical protein